MVPVVKRALHRRVTQVGLVVLAMALVAGLATGVVVGSGSSAPEAVIIGTAPDVVFLAVPPASLMPGAEVDTTNIIAFDEVQGYMLPNAIGVDHDGTPGTPVNTFIPTSIPKDTIVDSHFLHSDPGGQAIAGGTFVGDVTFAGEIIGVILRSPLLDGSDGMLGQPGVTYPTGETFRGLEVDAQVDIDGISISADGRTLSVTMGMSGFASDFDQIRVITKHEEPRPQTDIPRMPSLDQQLDILRDGGPPELVHQAIENLVQMNVAPPIILPSTSDDIETWGLSWEYYNRAIIDLEDSIWVLTDVKLDVTMDGGVRTHANAASVFLESVLSVARGLSMQVMDVAPSMPQAQMPQHLRGPGELDAPFIPFGPHQTRRFPVERTEVCNVELAEHSGGTTAEPEFEHQQSACVITKETFGLKAVLYHKVIPIHQEPWDVRQSPIIGHKVVWFIKWVPAEHIKVISHTLRSNGSVRTRIRQFDVLMPGLSKFWSFYPPDVSVGFESFDSS